MDIISHAAWGATIIRKGPLVWWAAFFGALPDLWTLIPLFNYLKANKFRHFSNKEFWQYVKKSSYYQKLYYYFHSIITALLMTVMIFMIFPTRWFVVLPYFFHIILDIFTHRNNWATRFFYPLSDVHFNNVNWWEIKWITVINWLLIFSVNAGIWFIIK